MGKCGRHMKYTSMEVDYSEVDLIEGDYWRNSKLANSFNLQAWRIHILQ